MSVYAEILDGHQVSASRRLPSDLVAEYDAKVAGLASACAAFTEAQTEILRASTMGGAYPGMRLETGSVSESDMRRALLRSAWRHVWSFYGFGDIASAKEKRRVEHLFEDPPSFTVDNIRDQFGDLASDPWGAILRGLAEVFSNLDPAYKSHEKVKIGAKGLPKRVILAGFNSTFGRGSDECRDILNALAAYQRKPLLTNVEMKALEKDGECLRDDGEAPDPYQSRYERARDPKSVKIIGRGVWLKQFANGNGHLFFGPEALRDINHALAEFYGDVLADCPDDDADRPAPRTGTAVARDLQFYPTPPAVIERLLGGVYRLAGAEVLEPSCGDGRILDALRNSGAKAFGVEVDGVRASEARAKGHNVLTANFLATDPEPRFDAVVMNPPFYGKHYAKHVRHAMRWLRPGGWLHAILPVTARYDHGLLDDLRPQWSDLPVGSFSSSGTNINTCIARILKEAAGERA